MICLFFNHIIFDKKTQGMVTALMERILNPKMASFDYTDEYTRQWFMHIYHLNKNSKLNRLNISSEAILTHLRKVSPKFCSTHP